MRFLADHDVYFITVQELRHAGHDVVTAKELQMQTADDSDLLAKARALDRIFLSRDKDFGTLVFLHALTSPGVIFLRISPTEVNAVHRVLHRLLHEQSEELLNRSYCVVASSRYRIRQLPQNERTTEEDPQD